jgi:hypothetical protein
MQFSCCVLENLQALQWEGDKQAVMHVCGIAKAGTIGPAAAAAAAVCFAAPSDGGCTWT